MKSGHARVALRAATAPDHAGVDAAFAPFDLTHDASYTAFLAAHAYALLPLEIWLDVHAAAAVDDWPARRRSDLLIDDLAAMGCTALAGPRFALPAGPATAAGVLYVVEGSRLGGKVLARQVPQGFPQSYLNAPRLGASWTALLSMLDEVLFDACSIAAAASAAKIAFARFEVAASACRVAEALDGGEDMVGHSVAQTIISS